MNSEDEIGLNLKDQLPELDDTVQLLNRHLFDLKLPFESFSFDNSTHLYHYH